ncbi:YtfJ family protein [Endozoicomonas sp. OPT23]|uniref:YtfJ family protein n=1 Tax=Endozoicomonas sp. OPT23 TaxID=2072845 RepID=UPI00129C0236|nr:YtfJ family protein [Endozoicomonas sp. OPT23]MRI32388.1 YtfJ family protein [Endozoicomonas sp. OPT23]
MLKKTSAVLALSLLSGFTSALEIEVGATLPAVKVTDGGEMVVVKDSVEYQSWSSDTGAGKVRLINAIAGRGEASEMTTPVMSSLTDAGLPAEQFQTVTLINKDDAMFGTGGFVQSASEENKLKSPEATIILDEEGTVHEAWDLQSKSGAIIVVGKDNKVLYVKEGAMSEADAKEVMTTIKANI